MSERKQGDIREENRWPIPRYQEMDGDIRRKVLDRGSLGLGRTGQFSRLSTGESKSTAGESLSGCEIHIEYKPGSHHP